jgi:pimeloyl-ACP methyl ester carboxylesterase
MHNSSSYGKRANECIRTRTLENIDKNIHRQNKKTPYDNVDENSDELDVYAQREIRLICIERPGFGDSSFLENRTVADYVDDVIEIVQRRNMPS